MWGWRSSRTVVVGLAHVAPRTDVARRNVLYDTTKFITRLLTFDRENIKDATIEAVMPYIRDKSFKPSEVKQLSSACVALCMWVLAMEKSRDWTGPRMLPCE